VAVAAPAAREADVVQPAGERPENTTLSEPYLRVGRYALFDKVASGGMATVHVGRLIGPVGFSRTVAIKRLHPNLASDAEFLAMLVDEARLASRIRHPNVVPMLDVVQANDELFLVMEYVHGASLSRVLHLSRGREEIPPIPVTLAIVCGVLHGLHAAHEAKGDGGESLHIVHRDVSPQNIMIGVDGIPRICDFGVAKARGRLHHTTGGQIKGKLAYMAPEQVLDEGVDRRADVFAAGVVLWQMLTWKRLYAGATDSEMIARILEGPRTPPSVHRRDVPPTLDAVVMRALRRRPEERFTSARELALAIEACVPIASPTQTGAWIDEVAREELAQRSLLVDSVESQPGGDAPSNGVDELPISRTRPASRDIERTAVSGAAGPGTSFPARTPPRRSWVGLLVAALLVAAVSVTAVWLGSGISGGAVRVAAADLPRAAAELRHAPPPAPRATEPELAEARPSAATTAAPARPPPARGGRPRLPPPPESEPPPPPPPPPRPTVDCDPPYWIDDRGVQRIKPQCL
jgi:serine/threonine-protein kinase